LRCAREKSANEEEARRRRHGGGSSVKEEARRNGGGASSVGAGSAREQAQNRNTAVGTATYDEVHPQDAYGMVTSDSPIMAPVYPSGRNAAPSVATTYEGSPQDRRPYPAPPVERRHSTDSNFDMRSGYDSDNMTSISQQRPQPTPTPSSVGTGMGAARAQNVADELTERKNWSVGCVIEVYSGSASKWFIAQLVEVGENANSHMITVQFVGDTGQIMQKSMPRSDVQIAPFGRNTRQMPPGFQKQASESRPGEFSYADPESGQKYQTKELAWQNYYAAILKSEQAQLLRQQALTAPSQEATAQRGSQRAPTMVGGELAQTAAFQPANAATPAQPMPRAEDIYAARKAAEAQGGSANYNVVSTVGDLRSLPTGSFPPITAGAVSSLPSSKSPFPGYGQSFAIGSNAGYEAYLASQYK